MSIENPKLKKRAPRRWSATKGARIAQRRQPSWQKTWSVWNRSVRPDDALRQVPLDPFATDGWPTLFPTSQFSVCFVE